MKNQRSKFSHIWGSEFLTKLLLFCCFLGISAFASAQQKVTGKVVDTPTVSRLSEQVWW